MPYADPEKQKAAMRKVQKTHRLRKKSEQLKQEIRQTSENGLWNMFTNLLRGYAVFAVNQPETYKTISEFIGHTFIRSVSKQQSNIDLFESLADTTEKIIQTTLDLNKTRPGLFPENTDPILHGWLMDIPNYKKAYYETFKGDV